MSVEIQDLSALLLSFDPGDQDRPPGVYTSAEIADALGVTHQHVRLKIKGMLRDGSLEIGPKVRTQRIDGAMTTVPSYRVVQEDQDEDAI